MGHITFIDGREAPVDEPSQGSQLNADSLPAWYLSAQERKRADDIAAQCVAEVIILLVVLVIAAAVFTVLVSLAV